MLKPNEIIQGLVSYPITPFTSENKVDEKSYREILNHLITAKANAIATLGSTGENSYLKMHEWEKILRITIEEVNGRVPVVVGISELTTEEAITKAKLAESLGADALMVLAASYWKLNEQEIYDHYLNIAKEVSLPIMLYNNPSTSGIDIKPELIVKMFHEIPNITMVKESSCDIRRMHSLKILSENKLPFYCGCNSLALEALLIGAAGWCTCAPNLIGDLPAQIIDAVNKSDIETARETFFNQIDFYNFIVDHGLVRAVKAGYQILGENYGEPRLPLQGLSMEKRNELSLILKKLIEY